jgi:hypothetical protein
VDFFGAFVDLPDEFFHHLFELFDVGLEAVFDVEEAVFVGLFLLFCVCVCVCVCE